MEEFEFYKKRDFSSYIGDSMNFFKMFGKSFIKNYLILNGLMLVIVTGLYYLFFKDYFSIIFHSGGTPDLSYFEENLALYIIGFIIFIIAYTFLTITSLGYPLVYVRLLLTKNKNEFTFSEIFSEIKNVAGRIFIFGLISFFILFPLVTVVMVVSVLLIVIIVGIAAIFITIPATMIWTIQSLYIYVYENAGYFDALKKGWKILFSNFWNIVGSTLVLYMLIMVIQGIFTYVPMMISMSAIITSGNNIENLSFSPLLVFAYVFSILLSFILLNLIYVQQLLVYFSSMEEKNNFSAILEIENIGQNAE